MNKTLSTIVTDAGITTITGAALNTQFVNAASMSQNSWVTYPWATPGALGVFTKRAVVGPAGSRGLAKQYYLGAGYNARESCTCTHAHMQCRVCGLGLCSGE